MSIKTEKPTRAERRAVSRASIRGAMEAWKGAPMTVKAMAGNWASPVLAALGAIDAELEQLQAETEGGKNGN